MVLPGGGGGKGGQVGLNFPLPVPFNPCSRHILVGSHLFVLFYIAKYCAILHNFPLFLPLPTPLLPPPVHPPFSPGLPPPCPPSLPCQSTGMENNATFFNYPSSNFSNFRIFLIPKNLGGHFLIAFLMLPLLSADLNGKLVRQMYGELLKNASLVFQWSSSTSVPHDSST